MVEIYIRQGKYFTMCTILLFIALACISSVHASTISLLPQNSSCTNCQKNKICPDSNKVTVDELQCGESKFNIAPKSRSTKNGWVELFCDLKQEDSHRIIINSGKYIKNLIFGKGEYSLPDIIAIEKTTSPIIIRHPDNTAIIETDSNTIITLDNDDYCLREIQKISGTYLKFLHNGCTQFPNIHPCNTVEKMKLQHIPVSKIPDIHNYPKLKKLNLNIMRTREDMLKTKEIVLDATKQPTLKKIKLSGLREILEDTLFLNVENITLGNDAEPFYWEKKDIQIGQLCQRLKCINFFPPVYNYESLLDTIKFNTDNLETIYFRFSSSTTEIKPQSFIEKIPATIKNLFFEFNGWYNADIYNEVANILQNERFQNLETVYILFSNRNRNKHNYQINGMINNNWSDSKNEDQYKNITLYQKNSDNLFTPIPLNHAPSSKWVYVFIKDPAEVKHYADIEQECLNKKLDPIFVIKHERKKILQENPDDRKQKYPMLKKNLPRLLITISLLGIFFGKPIWKYIQNTTKKRTEEKIKPA